MKDPLVSLVEMCEMERTIPKAYLELIPMAGHMLMQDQFEELNIMLRKFIARYWSSPSVSTFFPISEFSYFIIRFLDHVFFAINFSYFVIRFYYRVIK